MIKTSLVLVATLSTGILVGSLIDVRSDSQTQKNPQASTLPAHKVSTDTSDAGQQPVYGPNYTAMIDSLNAILEQEVTERRILESRLAELETELAELQTSMGKQSRNQPARSVGRFARFQSPVGIDAERFVEAGMDPGQAAILVQKLDESAMARLYLRDRAIREGWIDSQRYQDALAELPGSPESIRRDLGEPAYDRYLYAVGQPNRVVVGRVMDGSAAQRAGLQNGDTLLKYSGTSLFSVRDITNLTTQGEFGETIHIEVVRDGQVVSVVMPRGPLGVILGQSRVDPNSGG